MAERKVVEVTPEARAKAIRRSLRDDRLVRIHLTDPRRGAATAQAPPAAPHAGATAVRRIIVVTPEARARARAIRRALRDDSLVHIHMTDPRRGERPTPQPLSEDAPRT